MSVAARNQLVDENIGLVHACCRRFNGRGIEYDDLFQAGCLGLIRAADGFDNDRGIMFSTYAFPAIMGEIRRLFRDGGAVKVSRTLKELAMRCLREQERLSKKLGYEPSVGELAQSIGESPEQVAEALCAAQPTISLTYHDAEECGELDLPTEDNTDKLCEQMSLNQALSRLNERDRKMIELRYYSGLTQTETAVKLNMSQVQVSRREKAVIAIIREELKDA